MGAYKGTHVSEIIVLYVLRAWISADGTVSVGFGNFTRWVLLMVMVFLAAVSWGCILGSCVLFLVLSHHPFFLDFLAIMMYVN